MELITKPREGFMSMRARSLLAKGRALTPALEQALAEADGIAPFVPDGYTAESWKAFEDVLDVGPIEPRQPRCIQDLRDGKSYVYFIGGEGTPIKVGFSNAPHERLAQLQTGHWVKLRILAKVEGTLANEARYHARFAADRLTGEWFARTPEILAEIARLTTPPPPRLVRGAIQQGETM